MTGLTQGAAIYFDGKTGRRQAVAIALEDDALAIATPEGSPIMRWPYSDLQRLPASRRLLRLGSVASGSPARLEIRDPDFAEAVKARLGVKTVQIETSERRRRHRVVEWSIAAVASIIIIGVVGMPSLAELMLPWVPLSAEVKFSNRLESSVRSAYKGKGPFECGSDETEKAGKAVFLRLVGQLESAAALPLPLRPSVIRTNVVNATAFPGGLIHINKGAIDAAETPDELATVIAHELGHVAHRDGTRQLLHDLGISYLFGLVFGDFTGSGAMFVAANRVLGARHTRAEESAADAYGMALVSKIGGDSHKLAVFFDRFIRKRKSPSRDMAILRSHPADEARIAAILATPAVPNPRPLLTAQEWQALKRVCSQN